MVAESYRRADDFGDMRIMELQMPTNKMKPGRWYFVVECAKCDEAIPFLEAPSPEDEPQVKQRQIADLKCPSCGHVGTYAPALMYRDQAPERKAP